MVDRHTVGVEGLEASHHIGHLCRNAPVTIKHVFEAYIVPKGRKAFIAIQVGVTF